MQDTEIQFVTETGKVRKKWQMSWGTTSPTKWARTPFKMKCPALENYIQTTCMLRHEAILFCGISVVILFTYRSPEFSLVSSLISFLKYLPWCHVLKTWKGLFKLHLAGLRHPSTSTLILWIERAAQLHPFRQVFLLFPAELQTDGIWQCFPFSCIPRKIS